jgi:thiol-disulfide isomerase/thioredoxin
MLTKKNILIGFFAFGILFLLFYKSNFGKRLKYKAEVELMGTGLIQPKIGEALSGEKSTYFNYGGDLKDLEGNIVNIEDFKGKTLFINIWASWCGPCRAEMPYINSLYTKLRENDDIRFLMIATDEDFSKSEKFVKEKEFEFPVYHAFEGLNPSLNTKVIPLTVVVSPEGKIVFYDKGMNNFDNQKFRDFLTSF